MQIESGSFENEALVKNTTFWSSNWGVQKTQTSDPNTQTPPNMENSNPPKKSDQKTQTNTFKRCLPSPLTILISFKYCFCYTAWDNKVTGPSTMPNAPGMTLSLHVRESKTVLDSGFHAVDSGSSDWIPELLELHSGFQSPAIPIAHSKISGIQKSRLPHMGSVLGVLRSLRQSNPKMYTLIWYPDLPRISFFRTATQHNV